MIIGVSKNSTQKKDLSLFMMIIIMILGNTFVVFDTVQTISKELIDRLYVRGIKGTDNYDISKEFKFCSSDT